MKTLRPALLLLALLSVIGTAAAQPASHAISAVTVFPDRAAVTRTVEVELLAGANRLGSVLGEVHWYLARMRFATTILWTSSGPS